jgi:hypothetical protein
VIRATTVLCVSFLIAQLNYAKCGSEHTLKRAPNRLTADLTAAETSSGCTIVSVWPDRHLIEVRCPPSGVSPSSTAKTAGTASKEVQRYCIDGATIGAYRKKTGELVNCFLESEIKAK